MFFWRIRRFYTCCNKKILKASLRACHRQIDPNTSDIFNNPRRIKMKNSERTFFSAPSCKKASICLEATLSLSFFLLFFVNVFSILFLYEIYTEELTDLQQLGKTQAAYAFVTEGVFGTEEENICLQKIKKADALFQILPIPDSRLHIKCVVKPWNGYDVTKAGSRREEEALVYMTEHGKVYHKNRSCTYLSLSIQAISFMTIEEKRNESGECYYPCEYCGNKGIITIVFITSYGNKYHTTAKCRGLKRSVRSIPLSEVGTVNSCQKCG